VARIADRPPRCDTNSCLKGWVSLFLCEGVLYKERRDEVEYGGAVGYNDIDLLPGDEIWFRNPYYFDLSEDEQEKYPGEQGSNVFYIGDGKVVSVYGRRGEHAVHTIRQYEVRLATSTFECVKDGDPNAFLIRRVRTPVIQQVPGADAND
jgi:hypothetical protein